MDKKIGCVNHDCDKCNAQQQEPVGYWMGEFNDGAATLYEVPQESIFGRKYRNIPVYTTPPQRPSRSDIKPLTDEDLDKLADIHRQEYGQLCDAEDLRMFARAAIEAAHGIKE